VACALCNQQFAASLLGLKDKVYWIRLLNREDTPLRNRLAPSRLREPARKARHEHVEIAGGEDCSENITPRLLTKARRANKLPEEFHVQNQRR
jgi:hypothetical protein